MNDGQRDFIEKMGISFERSGATPMLGRVWGALLVSSTGPMSAEELATTLGASRGAISHATRQLAELLFIEKFRKPGDRKDYFRTTPQSLVKASRRRLQELQVLRELFEEGLHAMEDAEPEHSASLVSGMDFLSMWESTLENFFSEWQQHKGDQRAKRNSDNQSHQDLR